MSAKQWKCSCDIEVVFSGIAIDAPKKLASGFPSGEYCIEDKSDRGWGCVIARAQCWQGDRRDISKLVVEFISALRTVIQAAQNHIDSPVTVRLGVYYSTYNLTLSLDRKAVRCLEELRVELEISVYPTEDA